MTATCERCGQPFPAQRSTARYCSARCKKAAQRARVATTGTVVDVEFLGPVEKATRDELAAAQVLGTTRGQIALVLARLMDRAGPGQGSSVAAWSRELRTTLAEALRVAPPAEDDPITRIRRQMHQRREAAGLTVVPGD